MRASNAERLVGSVELLRIVKGHVGEAAVETERGGPSGEVAFRLPDAASANFPALFAQVQLQLHIKGKRQVKGKGAEC